MLINVYLCMGIVSISFTMNILHLFAYVYIYIYIKKCQPINDTFLHSVCRINS